MNPRNDGDSGELPPIDYDNSTGILLTANPDELRWLTYAKAVTWSLAVPGGPAVELSLKSGQLRRAEKHSMGVEGAIGLITCVLIPLQVWIAVIADRAVKWPGIGSLSAISSLVATVLFLLLGITVFLTLVQRERSGTHPLATTPARDRRRRRRSTVRFDSWRTRWRTK